MKNGISLSIKEAFDGVKLQWYVVDCPKKYSHELDNRWKILQRLIEPNSTPITMYLKVVIHDTQLYLNCN